MTLAFIECTFHTEIVLVGCLHVSEDEDSSGDPQASEKDTRELSPNFWDVFRSVLSADSNCKKGQPYMIHAPLSPEWMAEGLG